MGTIEKRVLEAVIVGVLYLLAAPVYLLLGVLRIRKLLPGLQAARRGVIECPYCKTPNPLDILATCRRCGVTEFGSRLYCSACRQVSTRFDCARCHATIKVL